MHSNFRFIVPVWGRQYAAMFANVCLPLLLTKGNLQHFSADKSAVFVIATTYQDSQYLSRTRTVQKLASLMQVQWLLIDGLADIDNAHSGMSTAYLLAMRARDVEPGATNFVFLTPDSFWSDGTFRRLQELVDTGYKAVMVLGLRVEAEAGVPYLSQIIENRQENPVIDNRELARFALQHLHPMGKAHDWLSDGEFLNAHPSQIYWKFGTDHMIAHCFHLHPLLVQCPRRKLRIGTTIDGDFLAGLGYKKKSFYVVQDSAEMIGLELSPSSKNWGQPLSRAKIGRVKKFSKSNANPLHWHFLEYRITYSVTEGYVIPEAVNAMISTVIQEIKRAKPTSHAYHYLVKSNLILQVFLKVTRVLRRWVISRIRLFVRSMIGALRPSGRKS